MSANIKKLKWAYFFSNCLLILSFVSAYLLKNHFSSFEIMSSQSLFLLLIILLEVPSGSISDRFGAKKALSISALAALLGWISIFQIQDIWNLVLYQFFFAIHSSLLSGSLESYLYQSLEREGREEEFKRHLLDLNSIKYTGMILAGLLGSTLFRFGSFRLLMSFTIVSSTLALFLMLSLQENGAEEQGRVEKSFAEIFRKALILFDKKSVIYWLVWDNILFGCVLASFFHMHQIILRSRGFPVQMNGVYTTVIFGLSILILQFYKSMSLGRDRELTLAMIINFAMTLLVLGIAWVRHPFVTAILWICLFSLRFLKRPLIHVIINKEMKSYSRATSLSIMAMMEHVGGILLAPILGYHYDRPGGILPIAIIVGSLLLGGLILLSLQRKRQAP